MVGSPYSSAKAAFVFITGAERTGKANNPPKRLIPRLSSRNAGRYLAVAVHFLLLSPAPRAIAVKSLSARRKL